MPFVLVDVELDDQAELRLIGRLVDGVAAPLSLGARVVAAFRRCRPGRPRSLLSRWTLRRDGVLQARNKVAIVGYAQSQIEPPRHPRRWVRSRSRPQG